MIVSKYSRCQRRSGGSTRRHVSVYTAVTVTCDNPTSRTPEGGGSQRPPGREGPPPPGRRPQRPAPPAERDASQAPVTPPHPTPSPRPQLHGAPWHVRMMLGHGCCVGVCQPAAQCRRQSGPGGTASHPNTLLNRNKSTGEAHASLNSFSKMSHACASRTSQRWACLGRHNGGLRGPRSGRRLL